jgi:hypothetical protein
VEVGGEDKEELEGGKPEGAPVWGLGNAGRTSGLRSSVGLAIEDWPIYREHIRRGSRWF